MSDVIRAITTPHVSKRQRTYNAPGRLGFPWMRVAELGEAVRFALRALRNGETDLAIEILSRVEQP